MGVLPFDPRAELLKSIALYNTKRNRFEKPVPNLFHRERLTLNQSCVFREFLDSFDASASCFCIVGTVVVAANRLIKSKARVVGEEAHVEVVDFRHPADR